MPDLIPITEESIRRFAPNAKRQYVETLLANLAIIDAVGIRESNLRLCHFMAQCYAETGGFTILRESLAYKTVAAIRRAWKARASKHTDDWIVRNLLGKPVQLGDWAYGGRMGNRKGTSDGFDYRGGGWIQTTGKYAVETYCKRCGIELRPDILDDYEATLKFASAEWKESNCNKWADQNNILALSKAINVGSATSNVMPNGMHHRRTGFRKAWAVWGEEKPEPKPVARAKDVAVVSRKSNWLQNARRVWNSITATSILGGLGLANDTSGQVQKVVSWPFLVAVITAGILTVLAIKYIEGLIKEDIEEGRYTPSGEVDPEPEAA